MNQSPDFVKELTDLINRFSEENKSNTPDYILAKYMKASLQAFNTATNERDKHMEMETPTF